MKQRNIKSTGFPPIHCATLAVRDAEDGMDIKVLQYIMGHSNTQITNNVYNHVNEERAVSEVVNVAERRRNRA